MRKKNLDIQPNFFFPAKAKQNPDPLLGIIISHCNGFCFYIYKFCLFISVCAGSSFLCMDFLQLQQAGTILVVCGLLIAVALGMHGLKSSHSTWVAVYRPQNTGSVVMAHEFSCSLVCAILPDQEIESSSPALIGGFLSITPPRKFL